MKESAFFLSKKKRKRKTQIFSSSKDRRQLENIIDLGLDKILAVTNEENCIFWDIYTLAKPKRISRETMEDCKGFHCICLGKYQDINCKK